MHAPQETLRQSAEEMDVRAMSLEELLAEHLDLSSRMNDACVKSVQLYGEVTPSFVLATFTHAGTPLKSQDRASKPQQVAGTNALPQTSAWSKPGKAWLPLVSKLHLRSQVLTWHRLAEIRFWNACESCVDT